MLLGPHMSIGTIAMATGPVVRRGGEQSARGINTTKQAKSYEHAK